MVIGPEQGDQACGETGFGRMFRASRYFAGIWLTRWKNKLRQPALCLQGLKVLISAGPTREPLDPVRYLTNRQFRENGFTRWRMQP